jgi:hypothetical protein
MPARTTDAPQTTGDKTIGVTNASQESYAVGSNALISSMRDSQSNSNASNSLPNVELSDGSQPAKNGAAQPGSDASKTSNVGNVVNGGNDWSTYGLLKTKTTQDAAGTTTTVMVDRNDQPYDVSVTAKDGSNTHLLFGPDGNPETIYENGPTQPDFLDFKTQNGTEYRFNDLSPTIDGKPQNGQVLPRLTTTSSDGTGGTVETFKEDTQKGWQTAKVEHDYANHNDSTYYDPASGTPYIEKTSENPDGGYNVGFFSVNNDITPIKGMDSYRMTPDGHGGQDFTYMKSDGTVDYRESVNQNGVRTRVDAYGNPLPSKS